jgi:hypothetical protein
MHIIPNVKYFYGYSVQWLLFMECSFSVVFSVFFISLFAWFLQHVWTFYVPHTTVTGSASNGKQKSDDDDEPSHLSLADRVRLFNQKIQDDSTVRVVPKQPPPTRRRQTQTARFKTHPVTTEEVESAARRISPLAASLTKPPDPKVLGVTILFMQWHVMWTALPSLWTVVLWYTFRWVGKLSNSRGKTSEKRGYVIE